jgi:hypothetical protein
LISTESVDVIGDNIRKPTAAVTLFLQVKNNTQRNGTLEGNSAYFIEFQRRLLPSTRSFTREVTVQCSGGH